MCPGSPADARGDARACGPRRCEPDGHARLASRLGLTIRAVDGVPSAVVAAGAPPGRSFIRFASGQVWIVDVARTAELFAWLTNTGGPHPDRDGPPGLLGFQLREGRRDVTLQLWSHYPRDPHVLSEIRVDGERLGVGSVRHSMPTVIPAG